MRFFSDISNKLIWVFVTLLLLAAGYVAVLNFWLKPKNNQVSNNPQLTINPQSNQQSKQTNTNTQTINSTPQQTNTNTQTINSTSQQTNTNTQTTNQVSQTVTSLAPALAQANEVELVVPQTLVKGAILEVFDNQIPNRSVPEKTTIIDELKLSDTEKVQQLTAFFFIPETGHYHFKVYGINKKNKNKRTFFPLRIDGAMVYNPEQRLLLDKGWHQLNFQSFFYRYYNDDRFSWVVNVKELDLKFRETSEKSFSSIEPYRAE